MRARKSFNVKKKSQINSIDKLNCESKSVDVVKFLIRSYFSVKLTNRVCLLFCCRENLIRDLITRIFNESWKVVTNDFLSNLHCREVYSLNLSKNLSQ